MQPSLLLIEDDSLTQDLIRSLCESRGFAVDAANDGFAGLKQLKDGGHSLALVDYHLPEMDGYALARLMRDLARGDAGSLNLIAITGDRQGLLARRGCDTLFDAVITKPVVPAQLFALLDRFSSMTSARRAAEELVRAPSLDRARTFAETLWRQEGLAGLPRALVRPPSSGVERATLAHAFDVVDDADAADVVLLSSPAGLGGIPSLLDRACAPLPLVDLSGQVEADAVFRIDDHRTWADVARVVRAYAERSDEGNWRPEPAADTCCPARGRPNAECQLAAETSGGSASGLRAASANLGPAARGPARGIALTERRGGVASEEAVAEHGPAMAAAPSSTMPPDAPERRAILLVERDTALNERARRILEGVRHVVHPATNLIQAAAILEAQRIDLVLLGNSVQGLDAATSRTLLRTLRGPGAPDIPMATLAADHAVATLLPKEAFCGVAIVSETDLPVTVQRLTAPDRHPVLDAGVYAQLNELFEPRHVNELLNRLLSDLDASFVGDLDCDELAQQAHKLISTAGMLGFVTLSGRCRRLEQTLRSGSDPHRDLELACEAVLDAATCITKMLGTAAAA